MNSIMSGLPNDIIINILKERRIMKQTDKYKKNYNFFLKEIKRIHEYLWTNSMAHHPNWKTGEEMINLINAVLLEIRENRTFLISELNEVFRRRPFGNPFLMLEFLRSHGFPYFIDDGSPNASSEEDN